MEGELGRTGSSAGHNSLDREMQLPACARGTDRPSEPSSARSLAPSSPPNRRPGRLPPPPLRITPLASPPSSPPHARCPHPLPPPPCSAPSGGSGGEVGRGQWRKTSPGGGSDDASGRAGRPGGAEAAGCCLKPRRELFRVGWVRSEGEGGRGRGAQHKISFEAALAHRTHVEYRRLATLAQTVLLGLRRAEVEVKARALSFPTQPHLIRRSGGRGRSGEPLTTGDGRTEPHM